jgi:hypothetical protein
MASEKALVRYKNKVFFLVYSYSQYLLCAHVQRTGFGEEFIFGLDVNLTEGSRARRGVANLMDDLPPPGFHLYLAV